MARTRKNYVLFKKEDQREPVLAGSYSSRKRAEESIKADAALYAKKAQVQASIEFTGNGAILWSGNRRMLFYTIATLLEDAPAA